MKRRRVTYRPNKAQGALGVVFGVIFIAIGLFVVTPVFGPFGSVFVAVCLLLFAFTSLLGTSYYGERGLQYLTGSDRWRGPFRAVFLAAVVAGSVGDVSLVWQMADIFNGLMALPNLCALLLLSTEALSLLRTWTAARTGGAVRPGRRRSQRR